MMRWNAEGLSGARIVRALGVAALAAYALGAIHAGAAEVAEVRVGTHDKSTRIVLELDRASGYRLVTPEDGGAPELLIHLDATSVARDVPSKSPVVRKVRVEPTASGSTVRVKLATSNVAVKELLLANPPRLVFDLSAQGPIPKAIAEEIAAEQAEPVAEVAAAKPAVPERSEPAPIVVAAAEPPPVIEKPTAEVAPPPAEAKPAMPPAPVDPIEEPEPAAVPIPAPPSDAKPITREAAMPPAPKPIKREAAMPPAPKPIAAKAPQQSTESGSLVDLAMSPIGMAGIGAFVVALLAIAVMRRRRNDDADEDPLYTVMAADDAASLAESNVMGDRASATPAAPIWEPDAFEASEPAPKIGPHQLSLGSRPAPEPEPEAEEIAPPDDSDSIFASEPEPIVAIEPERSEPVIVAPVSMTPMAPSAPMGAAVSEETERRIAELERRIEQLGEARERLERQVAAQTEELRVQRAAIARTQRVVRSIAKTEDIATEPVPRAPSAS